MNAPLNEEFLTLQEIYHAARRSLPPGPWSYLMGGAETETTVLRNRRALDEIAFRPRVLRDVRKIDCSAKFLGQPARARSPRALRQALACAGDRRCGLPGRAVLGPRETLQGQARRAAHPQRHHHCRGCGACRAARRAGRVRFESRRATARSRTG